MRGARGADYSTIEYGAANTRVAQHLGGRDFHEWNVDFDRLSRALSAFRADLGPAFERVVVVVMSEFLAPDQLFEGRDVPVTTDFRDVLAELCERHLHLPDASALFPGFKLERQKRLGFLG